MSSSNRMYRNNNVTIQQYGAPQQPYYAPHNNSGNQLSNPYQKNKSQDNGTCCSDRNDDLDYSIQDTSCVKCFLVVYRILAFALLCVRFYINVKDQYTSIFNVFQFLTHFGFSITIIFYALCNWDLLLNGCGSRKTVPKMPITASIFYQLALPTQVVVTALYWIIVYQAGTHTTASAWVKDIGNHGFPLAVLLLEFFFNLVPFYTRHLVILVGEIIFYLCVNLGYTLAVAPIYSAIDWKSGSSYVWVVVSVAVMGIVHGICQLIWYKCKRSKLEQLLQKEGR